MNCPKCSRPMKKVSWYVTNNGKDGEEYKEYDRNAYQCPKDDIWVTTEIPIVATSDTTTGDY